jgi:hypothetical protein
VARVHVSPPASGAGRSATLASPYNPADPRYGFFELSNLDGKLIGPCGSGGGAGPVASPWPVGALGKAQRRSPVRVGRIPMPVPMTAWSGR